jgi:hypothetical protein
VRRFLPFVTFSFIEFPSFPLRSPASDDTNLFDGLYPKTAIHDPLYPFLSILAFLVGASPCTSAHPASNSIPFGGCTEGKRWKPLPQRFMLTAAERKKVKEAEEERSGRRVRKRRLGTEHAMGRRRRS